MRMFFSLVFFLSLSGTLFADDLPFPASSMDQASTDGMVWNKWETENFIVLSIDFGFGRELKSSLESIRSDFCDSWGVPEKSLPVKCKVVCVPDQSLLKKFFSLEFPKCEIRTGSDSRLEISIWLDQIRSRELPGLVASACLHDRALFLKNGIPAIISCSPSEISEFVLSSGPISSVLYGENDRKSICGADLAACLFFRNEFGLMTFSRVVLDNGQRPDEVCGFPNRQKLEETMERYLDNLKSDLKSGKTPDSYLKR